jgi:hypothetical protein
MSVLEGTSKGKEKALMLPPIATRLSAGGFINIQHICMIADRERKIK